jgi:hypothetical protein
LTLRDHKDLRGGLAHREVTWCCYMNSPEDPRINFLSRGEWFRYVPPAHGVGSNIAPSYMHDSELEILPKQNEKRLPFHVDRFQRRFDRPFYYGRVGPMALILMFDTPQWLRFFLSPNGGGASLLPDKHCPAWDFMWVIPEKDYAVGREYTFRMRLAYKPFVSDDEIVEEYERAAQDLGFEQP